MKRALLFMLLCVVVASPLSAQTGNLALNGPASNVNNIGAGRDEYVTWTLTSKFNDKPVATAWGFAYQEMMDPTSYAWSIMYSDGIRSYPIGPSAGMSPHASDSMLAWYFHPSDAYANYYSALIPSDIPAIVAGVPSVVPLFTSSPGDASWEIYFRVSGSHMASVVSDKWPVELRLFTLGTDRIVKSQRMTPDDPSVFPSYLDFALDGTRCFWYDQNDGNPAGKFFIFDSVKGKNSAFHPPLENLPAGAQSVSVGGLMLKGNYAAWSAAGANEWGWPIGPFGIYVSTLAPEKTTCIEQGPDQLHIVDLDARGRALYFKAARMPSGSTTNELWYWDGHKSIRIADSVGWNDGPGDGEYKDAILAGDRIVAVGPSLWYDVGTYPNGYAYVYNLDDLEFKASVLDGKPVAVPAALLGGGNLECFGNVEISGKKLVWPGGSGLAIAMPMSDMLDTLMGSITTFNGLPDDAEADLVSTLQTVKDALFPPGPRNTKAGYDALVLFVGKVSGYGNIFKEQTSAFITPAVAALHLLSDELSSSRR